MNICRITYKYYIEQSFHSTTYITFHSNKSSLYLAKKTNGGCDEKAVQDFNDSGISYWNMFNCQVVRPSLTKWGKLINRRP